MNTAILNLRLLAIMAAFTVAGLVGGGADPVAQAAGKAPTITKVTPAHGAKIGKQVLIKGKNFIAPITVEFGKTQAAGSFTTTQLTMYVPAGCNGKVKITVLTTDGKATAPKKFTCKH